MPLPNPIIPPNPSRRVIQRAVDNITLRTNPGPGAIVAKTGNHYQVGTQPRRNATGGTTITRVRLTAFNSGTKFYTGVKMEPDGAGLLQDVSPAVTYTQIRERRDFIGIELGARVLIYPNGTASSTAAYVFDFVNPRQAFEVTVSQTGGSNGNATTQASWTYAVTNADGHALGTGMSPQFKGFRLAAGTVTAGTVGMASYDDAGALRLLTVNEVHGTGSC